MTGRVTLVGAGPGDAGLLTLRGLRALQDADVIVADRLGARAVLEQLAAEGEHIDAEVIDVGKLPGHHPVPQDGINELLVRLASEGRRVVRLKGGDPFVFGRGREEQQFCEQAGVPVEVVPGVTSAISVPAIAGIPLTHRGIAASFTVVSAHDQLEPGGPLSRAGGEHTVVLLMGVNTLGHSAHVLAAGARGADCPVAIIEDGYGPRERVTIGTLGTIARLAADRQVRSPAVIVVGDVVRLASEAAVTASGTTADTASGTTAHTASAPPSGRRFPEEMTIPGRIRRVPPGIVTGSANRHAEAPHRDPEPSPAPARARWADALDAGLAVDTGLIQAVDALESRSIPSSRD